MPYLLLSHLACIAAICISAFLTGHFILHYILKQIRLENAGFFLNVFVKLLFGTISIVFLTALIATSCNSVNLLWIPFFVLIFWRVPLNLGLPAINQYRQSRFVSVLTILLWCLLMPFFYFAFIYLNSGEFPFNAIDDDIVVYSRLSAYLMETGIENRWAPLLHLSSQSLGAEPYHYFELWLNGMVSKVSGLYPAACLTLVIWPYFTFLALTSLLALLEFFDFRTWHFFFAPILFVSIVSPAPFSFISSNLFISESPFAPFGAKVLCLYPFLFLSLILMQRAYRREALLSLMGLAICNIVLLPAICVFILLICVWIRQFKWLIPFGIFFVAFLLFYSMNVLAYGSNISAELAGAGVSLNFFGQLEEAWRIFREITPAFLLSNIILLVLLLFALRSRSGLWPVAILAFASMFLTSLLIGFLVKYIPDRQQFFTLPLLVTTGLSLLLLLEAMRRYRANKTWSFVIPASLLLLSVLVIRDAFRTHRKIQELAAVDSTFHNTVRQINFRSAKGDKIAVLGPVPFKHDLLKTNGYSAMWPFCFSLLDPIPIGLNKQTNDVLDPAIKNLISKTPGQILDLNVTVTGNTDSSLVLQIIKTQSVRCIISKDKQTTYRWLNSHIDTVLAGPVNGSYCLILKD